MNRALLQAVLRRVEVQSANGPRPLADVELLRRFAAERDEAAFTVLVGRHGPLVWAVCRNLLANETDAEDAFQATFLALIESAGRIRTAAVGAWLHGVAVRVARMAKRSAARRRQRERKAAATESVAPVANATWSELQAAVHEEVGQLPESLRAAFVLCNLQGKSQRDVAAELGWKPGTLSGRLSQARRQLLERLAKRGVAAGSVVAAVVAGGAEAMAGAPPALLEKVAVLARGIDPVHVASPILLELARAATEVTMTRTKLICIAAALTGILIVGYTLLPPGSAQEKKPLQPGGGVIGGPGGIGGDASGPAGVLPSGGSRAVTGAWEYKYVIRQSNRLDDFQNTLSSHSASGWEYVGTETLQVTDSAKKTDLGSAPILVFKRPTGAGRQVQPAPPGSSGIPKGSFAGMSGFSGTGFAGFSGGSGLGGFSGGSGFGAMGANPFGGPTTPPGKKESPKPPGEGPSTGGAGAAAPGSPTATRREYQIITLKHATATSMAKSLQELFSDGNARIVAEPQTNSILIHADKTTIDLVTAVLAKLDVPAAKRTP